MDNIDIEINKKDMANLLDMLKKLSGVITFTYQKFNEHKEEDKFIIDNDYWVGISLIESYTSDLLEIVSFESSLVEEKKKRHQKVREANNKIRALEKKLGEKVDIQDISYGIQNYVSKIEEKIFGYCKISFDKYGGIEYDISYRALFNIAFRRDDDDNGYANLLKELNELGLDLIENDEGIRKETYYDILDTNKNRLILENYMVEMFGVNSAIREFSSSRGRKHNEFVIDNIKGYTHFRNINLS